MAECNEWEVHLVGPCLFTFPFLSDCGRRGLFRWASTMFGSRSFTSQVLSNTLPADKARPMGHLDPDHEVLSNLFEDGFAVLLPLLDLLNYRPFSKVEWQAGLNEIGLQVLESFDGGQEVCNNYGPRDNEARKIVFNFFLEHS